VELAESSLSNILSPTHSLHTNNMKQVMNALDNVDARRHVNRLCLAAGKVLVEAGTTGFDGQSFVIAKGQTACYECQPKPTQKVRHHTNRTPPRYTAPPRRSPPLPRRAHLCCLLAYARLRFFSFMKGSGLTVFVSFHILSVFAALAGGGGAQHALV
jgi:hypothetical protein